MTKRYTGVEFVKVPTAGRRLMRGVHFPLTVYVEPGYEVFVYVEVRPPTGVRRCLAMESGGARCVRARGHRGAHRGAPR